MPPSQAPNKPNIISRDNILALIYEELEKVNQQAISVDENTDIATDLNVDSVAIMDIVFELEERFDISVSLNDLADTRTVKDLTDLVLSLSDK